MRLTDDAIVLHLQKYSDKMSILHLLTKQNGRMQYMVYGLHSKKSQQSVFNPLSYIEIEAEHQKNKQFQRLISAQLKYIPKQSQTDIVKHSLSLFIAEVIYRSVHLPVKDDLLFNKITECIQQIDLSEKPENIHLSFMLHLAQCLGIGFDLDSNYPIDMLTGEIIYTVPYNTDYFSAEEIKLCSQLYETTAISLSRQQRQQLLRHLCRYFELQLEQFSTPKSLDILTELFN